MKKIASFLIILCLLFSAMFMDISPVKALTSNEIQLKMYSIISSEYKPGSTPPSSSYRSGTASCFGFVDLLCRKIFGHNLASQKSAMELNSSSNFSKIGSTLSKTSGTLSESSLKSLLTNAQPGDIIQMDYTTYDGVDSRHTMMVYSVSSSGIVCYHAGKSKVFFGQSSDSQPLWGTGGSTLTWSNLLYCLRGGDDGISLYRSLQNGSSGSTSVPSTSDSYSSTNPDDYTYPETSIYYTSPTTKGSGVAWIQAVLYQLGYTIIIDGSYGPATVTVVKQFQSDYGLEVDGRSGANTRAKLKELWNAKNSYSVHIHYYYKYMYQLGTHPHYDYYKCSCGEDMIDYYSGSFSDNCSTCTYVGKSSLTLSSTTVTVGSKVTASWAKADNAVYYSLKYFDDDMNYYPVLVGTTGTTTEFSFDKAGTYYVYVDSISEHDYYTSSPTVTVTVKETTSTTSSKAQTSSKTVTNNSTSSKKVVATSSKTTAVTSSKKVAATSSKTTTVTSSKKATATSSKTATVTSSKKATATSSKTTAVTSSRKTTATSNKTATITSSKTASITSSKTATVTSSKTSTNSKAVTVTSSNKTTVSNATDHIESSSTISSQNELHNNSSTDEIIDDVIANASTDDTDNDESLDTPENLKNDLNGTTLIIFLCVALVLCAGALIFVVLKKNNKK